VRDHVPSVSHFPILRPVSIIPKSTPTTQNTDQYVSTWVALHSSGYRMLQSN
jgi:hypothetical protein